MLKMFIGSIFPIVSWSPLRAKRPVRSIGAAKILAAGEAVDEVKMLARTRLLIYSYLIPLRIALDSKDQFTSLYSQRSPIEKSIRADENANRYEFERKNIDGVIWIPGRENLSDPGTKTLSTYRCSTTCEAR